MFIKQHISPTHLQNIFRSLFPKDLKNKYKWGLQTSKPLANSYIFPKRKKKFTNARPIISFANTSTTLLLKGLSHAIIALTKIGFPGQFHKHDIASTFRFLHKYLRQKIENLLKHNDDLVGFYTSVPHARILAALLYTLDTYSQLQPAQHGEPISFTVRPKSKCKFTRFVRGRSFTKSGKAHIIHLEHIHELIIFTLTHSYFTSLGTVYRQKRGSCIGSPLSPTLCNLVVAFEEHLWHITYHTHITRTTFCTRYVDNRLILILPSNQNTEAFKILTDLDFYKSPVTLEPEKCNKFLGFTIDHVHHTCTYIVPPEHWQYRSAASAGSTQSVLSGMASRLHIIKRGTYPATAVPQTALQLLAMYRKQDFDINAIVKVAKKVFPKILARTIP